MNLRILRAFRPLRQSGVTTRVHTISTATHPTATPNLKETTPSSSPASTADQPSSLPPSSPSPSTNTPSTTSPTHPFNIPSFTTLTNPLTIHLPPSTPASPPSHSDLALAQSLITAWRRDGIAQLAMPPDLLRLYRAAHEASKRFFALPRAEKEACVNGRSYAGYVASGEEVTGGVRDYSEVFTVTRDFVVGGVGEGGRGVDGEGEGKGEGEGEGKGIDGRVRAGWPCHGPVPWPKGGNNGEMREAVMKYKKRLGEEGEKLLRLAEIGLGVEEGALRRYTRDGWHHMRMLRFPARDDTNGKGKEGRGIGSHTDYGLLIISAQDEVGGLFIRRPNPDERVANWETSAAGLREDDDGWVYVPPVAGVHTVILGDMMQYLTHDYLRATPHKVGLNTCERYAIAYFHEPSFQAVLRPLEEGCGGLAQKGADSEKGIHYGTHFTNMCMRNYPDRITTRRLIAEDRYKLLQRPELRTMGATPTL